MNVWNIIAIILGTLIIVSGLALIIYLLVNKIKFNKELKNIVVIDPKVENEALKKFWKIETSILNIYKVKMKI